MALQFKLGLIPIALWATPAHADWQYTRWGMSPQQVEAASNGAVKVGTGDPSKRLPNAQIGATGTHQSGPFKFNATFYFTENKFSEVRMQLISSTPSDDGYQLKNALDGKYGEPFRKSANDFITTYHDRENNLRIDLMMIGNQSTSVIYRPLQNNASAGL